jgi:putative membrane protein insertion efficiency factor
MQILNRIFRNFLMVLIGAYRTIGTTHLGGTCRFEPSCSGYALEAARIHPPHTALRLIASRVVRCRPGGAYGDDPVPPLKSSTKILFAKLSKEMT